MNTKSIVSCQSGVLAADIKYLKTGRIPELDGVRGIAILLVLVHHYIQLPAQKATGFASYLVRSLGMTWSGVDLFFVLSGFLIGGILLENRNSQNYFKTFYIRRACRIFPLYFFWLSLFLLAFHFRLFLPASDTLERLIGEPLPLWSYCVYVQNGVMALWNTFGSRWMAVTWSLAVEEQFYIILPFLLYFLPDKKLPLFLKFSIIAAPLLRGILVWLQPHNSLHAYVLMPCRTDSLLLGVLGAYWLRDPKMRAFLFGNPKMLYFAFYVLIAGAALLAVLCPGHRRPAMMCIGYTWLALFYLVFVLIALSERSGIVTHIVRSNWLQRLGIIAYGVYIYHEGVNYLVHGFLLHQKPTLLRSTDALATLVALVLTLFIAYFSWIFFERRFISVGHSYHYR